MKKIKIPIYNLTLFVTFDKSECDGGKLIKIDPRNVGEVSRGTNEKGNFHIQLYIEFENYSTELLIHETIHASWRILQAVGITVNVNNHEALSYLSGFIGHEVNKYYYEVKKQKGKVIHE